MALFIFVTIFTVFDVLHGSVITTTIIIAWLTNWFNDWLFGNNNNEITASKNINLCFEITYSYSVIGYHTTVMNACRLKHDVTDL